MVNYSVARSSFSTSHNHCLYALPKHLHLSVTGFPIPPSLLVKHQSARSLWSHLFPDGPHKENHTLRDLSCLAPVTWRDVVDAHPWCRSHGCFVPLHGGLTSQCTKRPQSANHSSTDGHWGCFQHFTTVDTVAMSARISVLDPVFHSFG